MHDKHTFKSPHVFELASTSLLMKPLVEYPSDQETFAFRAGLTIDTLDGFQSSEPGREGGVAEVDVIPNTYIIDSTDVVVKDTSLELFNPISSFSIKTKHHSTMNIIDGHNGDNFRDTSIHSKVGRERVESVWLTKQMMMNTADQRI